MSCATTKCLNSRQVCKALGVSLSTLHRLRKHSNFPEPVVLGKGAKRYREEDVLRWLSEQRDAASKTAAKEG